ncbi:MAG TPA: tetratricopeptide repeat protein [Thermoanaerobaculia bacterium]|jgi:tetratricopeptide (TPR) repeat protein|nr:tetratricopeptide repeat protein [Thermoanaerobaculia bacterium]
MAQPGINAKLEELQFRLKTDPKSRLFFQLAEELRRHGKLTEAEQVLRNGLHVHTSYLSAWVSLGRVLREQNKNAEAVEALTTAMQVDPGNVVAARLLADAYLVLGEKVEAIKKYKLVNALMPSEELEAKIADLDREIQGSLPVSPEQIAPEPEPDLPPQSPFATAESSSPFAESEPEPEHTEELVGASWEEEPVSTPTVHASEAETPEAAPAEPYHYTVETPFDTGDDEPMAARHAVSPFEDPAGGYTAAALEVEQPEGMHVEEMPVEAAESDPWSETQTEAFTESEPAAEVFAPAEPEPALAADADADVTETTTMADLYVRQGLIDDARKIYEHVLQRNPDDHEVRAKLEALTDSETPIAAVHEEHEPIEEETHEPVAGSPKVRALEQWLAKVGRREEGRA